MSASDDYRARVRAATEGFLRTQHEIAAKAAAPRTPKPHDPNAGPSESSVMRAIERRAPELGVTLYRNQVGSYRLQDGRWIRSGLAVGSPDYVGWVPVRITPEMVGRTVAVFVGVEAKRPDGGRVSDAQRRFLERIAGDGGIAGVCRSVEDLQAILDRKRYCPRTRNATISGGLPLR